MIWRLLIFEAEPSSNCYRWTARCRYNAVNFLQNPHKRNPITRPRGRAMGCVFWVQCLVYMRGVGYCCALCRLPIDPSARPAPVTTLQPTMSNGSNGCVSCVHFLGSSGTVKFYEYTDWLASWTRPADVFPSFGMYFMGNITKCHYSDDIMRMMASQFAGVSMVCATVWPGADQRKHQSSESLEFVGNSPVTIEFSQKGPMTRKMFPFNDVIMPHLVIEIFEQSVWHAWVAGTLRQRPVVEWYKTV